MNCLSALNLNGLNFNSVFGLPSSYESRASFELYKAVKADVETLQDPLYGYYDEDCSVGLSSVETVRVDAGLSGKLQLASIFMMNLFSIAVYGSRKWEFVPLENFDALSGSAYINTWSFTEEAKERFQKLKDDHYTREIWREVRETKEPVYLSRKEGIVETSHYLTDKYIFMHTKSDGGAALKGNTKTCGIVEEQLSQQRVACLKPSLKGDPIQLERMRKEISFLERLKGSPHVIQMLAADRGRINTQGKEKLAVYLDYYNQGDLLDYLNRNPHLDYSIKMKIATCLIEGLKAIHGRGIVHNDLKLENILIRGEKSLTEAGICDFDLASDKRLEAESVGGTVDYCSPEKIWKGTRGEYFSHEDRQKADVWALGLMLGVLLLGIVPVWFNEDEGMSRNQEVIKKLFAVRERSGSFFDEPKDLDSLEHLIWEMLQFDASKRPAMDQVAERWLSSSQVRITPLG